MPKHNTPSREYKLHKLLTHKWDTILYNLDCYCFEQPLVMVWCFGSLWIVLPVKYYLELHHLPLTEAIYRVVIHTNNLLNLLITDHLAKSSLIILTFCIPFCVRSPTLPSSWWHKVHRKQCLCLAFLVWEHHTSFRSPHLSSSMTSSILSL